MIGVELIVHKLQTGNQYHKISPWTLNLNTIIFIQENVVCITAAILSWSRCVKGTIHDVSYMMIIRTVSNNPYVQKYLLSVTQNAVTYNQ